MTAFCGPENLALENRPTPEVGARQVLIDVEAAGVDYIDIMATIGQLRSQYGFDKRVCGSSSVAYRLAYRI